jgi:DNA polymerase-3 subunit alpha
MLAAYATHTASERESSQASLFGAEEPAVRPPLPKAESWSAQERLDFERESVGFYLSGHPLSEFYAHAPSGRFITFADLTEEGGDEGETRTCEMAGVVRQIKSRPSQSGGMLGWVTLSDPTGEYEAIVMPEHYGAARELLEVGKAYVYRTRVRWRDGDIKIAADTFERVEAAEARTAADLRIVLKEGASLAVLAQTLRALAPPQPGEARPLKLILRLKDGREVEVSPPGAYPAGAGARAAVKAARGVERVM